MCSMTVWTLKNYEESGFSSRKGRRWHSVCTPRIIWPIRRIVSNDPWSSSSCYLDSNWATLSTKYEAHRQSDAFWPKKLWLSARRPVHKPWPSEVYNEAKELPSARTISLDGKGLGDDDNFWSAQHISFWKPCQLCPRIRKKLPVCDNKYMVPIVKRPQADMVCGSFSACGKVRLKILLLKCDHKYTEIHDRSAK